LIQVSAGYQASVPSCSVRPFRYVAELRRNDVNASPTQDSFFHERVRLAGNALLWLGIALVMLGIAAIIFPIISTLVATFFVGGLLLLAGCLMLTGLFSIIGAGPFFGAVLLSLLSIGSGAFLLFNPLGGAMALTLIVGLLFMVQGTFELFFALEMRPYLPWVGMLISAILSIAIALLIIIGWPGISLIALGVLIGVNFISSGVGYIAVSRAMRP
jgi:uncharacterized membrane protein HdeD (DUF308 family)